MKIENIHDLIKRNPTIGLNELYGKLRQKYKFNRNPATLYRFLWKDGFYKKNKNRKRYIPRIMILQQCLAKSGYLT